MADVVNSTNYLITLSETIGPIWAFIIVLILIISPSTTQALIHRFRRRNLTTLVEKEVNRVLSKVEETEEDITIILELIRNMAQAVLSINQKMKYTLSDKDSISMLRLITTGNLLLNIFVQSMLFSIDVKDRPEEIVDLREQFILEMENKWMNYVDNLNLFRSSLKIGDFVDDKHKFIFFNSDIMKGELGMAYKIRDIVFNPHVIYGMKYSRINTLFSNFSQEVTHSLGEELNKILNGGS